MDKDDLRWFLYEEHMDMYKRVGGVAGYDHFEGIFRSYISLYSRRRIPYGCFDLAVNGFSSARSSLSGTGRKIMFQSFVFNRYPHIIREASRDNRAFIFGNGLRQVRMMADRHVFYLPAHRLYNDLYSGIVRRDDRLLMEAVKSMRKVLEKRRPDVIVLNDDAMPDNRLTVMVAKELGIPTVEIQHGIYQSEGMLNTGYYVDYLFTWGQYFNDVYVRRGVRKADRIKVLGYPYEIHPFPPRSPGKPLTLCYLGQDTEKFIEGTLQYKLDTVRKLKALCDEKHIDFIYRPHPGDDRAMLQRLMPEVTFTVPGETLDGTIGRSDICVAFNSTTLIEAALKGRLTLQLKTYPFGTDDYRQMGICPRSFWTVEEMSPYLEDIVRQADPSQFYVPVDPSFIQVTPQGPGRRLLELLDEII